MGQWFWKPVLPVKNVHILGLDSSGKTTILYQWVLQETLITCPTSGMNMETIEMGHLLFRFFDFSGNKSSRSFWKAYLPTAHAVIWVVDTSDKNRMDENNCVFKDIIGSECFEKKPILILANKQDVPHALETDDIIKKLELDDIHDRPWEIFSCIAKEGQGLKKPLQWLMHQIDEV